MYNVSFPTESQAWHEDLTLALKGFFSLTLVTRRQTMEYKEEEDDGINVLICTVCVPGAALDIVFLFIC